MVALIGAGVFSALSPTTASACSTVTNPDGSKTCTSVPYTDPCDAGGTYIVDYIPLDATITGHQLTNNPACPNSTIVENSFEDNAVGYSPPAGHRAVKVTYTITCNSPPCTGSTQTTLAVSYTQPSSGGGGGGGGAGQTPTSPPSADPAQLPGKAKVDPKSGKASIPWNPPTNDEPYKSDLDCFIDSFTWPTQRSAEAAAKGRMGGTLNGSHPAGQGGTLTLQLNGRARRALAAAGKMTVAIRGTISNATGSTPFTGTLKLVAKKSKK